MSNARIAAERLKLRKQGVPWQRRRVSEAFEGCEIALARLLRCDGVKTFGRWIAGQA
jgi:hypothetical protein